MRIILMLVCLALGQAIAVAQNTALSSTQEMHRIQQDSKAYIARLEDPMRDGYQKPAEVVKALKIKEGEVIADVGAGSGYFSFPFARAVGPSGRVYAVDVNADMVRHMNRRIRDLKATNVATVLCPFDDPLLMDGAIDRVFICDTWHHIPAHPAYLERLRRALRPGGQIVIIDFHAEATSEKIALAWHLDGKASAVIGTHTHVQTADERILPGGTAFITDAGMTGPTDSVIGVKKEQAIARFLTQTPHRFEIPKGPVHLCAVIIDVDGKTGKANAIERIHVKS